MEKYLSSSAVQISAAAVLAILVGLFVGYVSHRDSGTNDTIVATDTTPLPGMNDTDLNRVANANRLPPGPVSGSLPTEPDADTAAQEAAASAGRYANVVPDKAPVRTVPAQKPVPTQKPKPAPAEKPKPRNDDQTTLHVRRLQTQLMVGALSCGQQRMITDYNSFVAKFDRALKANGVALKSYFARTFGARGSNEMDAFITKLSNELSLVSMRNPGFCERTGGLFDSVLALAPGEIEAFADRYLSQPMVARDGF